MKSAKIKLLKQSIIVFSFVVIILSCNEEAPQTAPEVITGEITNTTSTSAKVSGQITSDGNAPITESGVVYGKNAEPTIADGKVLSGATNGNYTIDLTALDFATTYNVRAFATNKVGTSYGLNKALTTSAVLPTITTKVITDIKSKTAIGGGNISSDGGSPITAKGVCWNTSPNPTISNSRTTDGTATGSFTSPISGLNSETKYYVRAYTTNAIGTAYGEELTFTTLNPIYLDANGVTIKCYDWAAIGEKGVVNGIEYTILGLTDLKNLIGSGGDCSKICTSKIIDIGALFFYKVFNGDISKWDISNVYNMNAMFSNSTFNGDISNWDVSKVSNINSMFQNSAFNGDISKWNVSSVTDMGSLFAGAKSFNGDISNWDVSRVTNMESMFSLSVFNNDISKWNVSNVTNMKFMFYATPFDKDISSWNVGKVTTMDTMFQNSSFNGDIGNWDVSNVTNMTVMFGGATSFNRDLSKWNVSKVTNCSLFSNVAINWTLPKPNFTNCTP